MYVDEILIRVSKMWAYGGHYHSFVTYINAIFRFYIWHLSSQPMISFSVQFHKCFGATLAQD